MSAVDDLVDDVVMDRVRRQADSARGIGMRVSVVGSDLALVLAALDGARQRLRELEQSKPKCCEQPQVRVPRGAAGKLAAVVSAADDVLRNYPELWGQSLVQALRDYEAKMGVELPDGWAELIGGLTAD